MTEENEKTPGEVFLEKINAAETPAELDAIIAEQQAIETKMLQERGWAPTYDPAAAKSLEGANTPEELAQLAEESGFAVDFYGNRSTPESARQAKQAAANPDDIAKAIAEAKTPSELTEIMEAAGLRVSF